MRTQRRREILMNGRPMKSSTDFTPIIFLLHQIEFYYVLHFFKIMLYLICIIWSVVAGT